LAGYGLTRSPPSEFAVNFSRINDGIRRTNEREQAAGNSRPATGAGSGLLNFSRPSRRPLLRENRAWHFSDDHFIRQAGF